MISVVIATLNDEARLGRALAPLVPAAISGLVREVIVADAGSTDATLEIAEDAGARIVAGGVEAGRAAAKSDWLLILHPGVQLLPGWEAAAREHVERNPGAAARVPLVRPGEGALAALRRSFGRDGPPEPSLEPRSGRGAPRPAERRGDGDRIGSLLPLREKVSAKPTDEGSLRTFSGSPRRCLGRIGSSTPHPALRATFSR